MPVRLPSFEDDSWRLRSGEESHQKNPDSFWIPPLEERQNLRRGQAARLIFDIEGRDEDGSVEVAGERMWVIVSRRIGDTYIGILDNQPSVLDPDDGFYLTRGAEVPFRAEHVIDTDDPPEDYVRSRLAEEPRGRWPRAEHPEPGAAGDVRPGIAPE